MSAWQPVRCWWCGQNVGSTLNCYHCRLFNRRVVLPRMAASMTDDEFRVAVAGNPVLLASYLDQVRRDATG